MNQSGSVQARVDRAGRLIQADPEIEAIHREAGGAPGGLIALPQLAVIARLAFRLGVPIERPVLMASEDSDIHCWVRAVPDADEAVLTLENWSAQPARGPRFGLVAPDTFAATGSSGDELVWTSDSDLKLTEVSPALATMLGVTGGEAIGMPLTKLLRLVEDDGGEMPIINALAARQGFTGQQARSRSDERVELVIEGSAQASPDGRFAGFRGTARGKHGAAPADGEPGVAGSRSRRMEPSFEEVLRLPIERIVAEAEKISARSDGPLRSDYGGYGADIAAAARHLLSVLSAMGDDPEYGRGLIDLSALAAEAVVLVDPIAESRKVKLVLDTVPPTHASGEEHAVIQILVNLLVNAIRHSPADGIVSIGFATGDDSSSVTVSDQGVGIAPADHKRIFERFERADEKPGGTGLGLAIARRLARSMGGDVQLESTPGKGAHFTLSLPLS